MRKIRLLFLIFMALGILLVCLPNWLSSQEAEQAPQTSALLAASPTSPAPPSSPPSSPAPSASLASVTYEAHSLPQSTVHVVRIPVGSSWQVTPVLASGVDTVGNMAEAEGAIAAVNGGFFDPVNQQTTSYIVLNGELVANPTENERLMNNPDMIPYLDRILNRSELRQYQCGQTVRYAVAPHHAPVPVECQLLSALGAGPQLLPQLTLVEEGFAEVINGEKVRDALGSAQPNARTAVGIAENGDVVLVMAAQRSDSPSNSGLSLPELAEFMQTLGVTTALNLDGGSSSALYYQGQTYFGKVDTSGDRVERPVKSVLLVQNAG